MKAYFLNLFNIFLIVLSAVASLAFTSVAHAGWQQTFGDEFTSFNLDVWNDYDSMGFTTNTDNGDQECYDFANKQLISGGGISLFATNVVPSPSQCYPANPAAQYTSAEINSLQGLTQTYGYFEVRAKVPHGQGLSPQVRLSTSSYVPPLPEMIYLMNFNGGDTTKPLQQYDYTGDDGQKASSIQSLTGSIDYSQDYHNYGVDWQPGLLVWYIDGVEVNRYAGSNVYNGPMFLLINLAVGNSQAGSPDASTTFPADLDIAYVHAYQRVDDGTPDDLPPGAQPKGLSVRLTQPTQTIQLKAGTKVTFAADASDSVAIKRLTFTVDGLPVCIDNKAPYGCTYKLPKAPLLYKLLRIPFTVTVKVQALDVDGNRAEDSASITVSS